MIIDKEALTELKALHLRKTGVQLTDREATEMGLNLIQATELVFGIDSQRYMCNKKSRELWTTT